MRLGLSKFARFRPRIVTVIVFCIAVAMIVLANLTFDEPTAGGDYVYAHYRSYGWPIVWHRLVLQGFDVLGNERTIGWYFSATRFVLNLALWLALLATVAGTCEWLVRRYRPRPRWSLRALLLFVGFVAAGCAWYAKARNRAELQDPLIGLRGGYGVPLVYVERWGPKWLDLFGADRLRRRIVLASGWQLRSSEPEDERRFLRLSRLSDVRHLGGFYVDELTATTAKALGDMAQLETLSIRFDRLSPSVPAALSDLRELRSLSIEQQGDSADEDYARLCDECLAAIGNMPRLESLHLQNLPLRGKSLACLSASTNLKSLTVDFWDGEYNGGALGAPAAEDCLRAIGELSQLEWLSLEDLRIKPEGLAYLTNAKLKILRLEHFVTDDQAKLSHLPPLASLAALDLSESKIDDADLRLLAALPNLKSLSLGEMDRRSRSFTVAGLAELAAFPSLEEVSLEGAGESPEGIKKLLEVENLKRLYLGGNPAYTGDEPGILKLDDGKELHVSDLSGFRGALQALRKAKPGIAIKMYRSPVFDFRWGGVLKSLNVDAAPERPSAWLPGRDTKWMTPQEWADFENAGGSVGFDRAVVPDGKDGLITVVFDAPRGKR